MSWYTLQATDDLDEHLLEDCWRLCRDLTCSAGDAGHSCAIFERLSGDQRTFFFAPAVGLLASKLGAEPCRKPSPDGLFLVHGETGAWRAHFCQTDRAQSDLFESTYRLAL
jgi:hypothetical protein